MSAASTQSTATTTTTGPAATLSILPAACTQTILSDARTQSSPPATSTQSRATAATQSSSFVATQSSAAVATQSEAAASTVLTKSYHALQSRTSVSEVSMSMTNVTRFIDLYLPNQDLFETADFMVDSFKIPAPVAQANYTQVEQHNMSMSLRLSESESSRRQSSSTLSSKKKVLVQKNKAPKRLSASHNPIPSEKCTLSESRLSTSFSMPGTEKIIFKCDECNGVYSSKSGFTRHKCHSRSNFCSRK